MKKTILAIAFGLMSMSVFAQSEKAEQMLSEIKGKYSVDDNGNVTYVKVVTDSTLSKDEIYQRALNYFVYNYGSGKSVIQTQDKEAGTIVAKGIYAKVHIGSGMLTNVYDANHIIRIDVKEGKVRIIVSLTEYEIKLTGGNGPPSYYSTIISQTYPINEEGNQKTMMSKAFYKTHLKALESIDRIEKAIKEGNTSKKIELSENF